MSINSSNSDNANVAALPFTASSPDVTLNLGLTLCSELLLGVRLHDIEGSINAGFFIDAPYVNAKISGLEGMNANCEPINTGSSSASDSLAHAFPNLAHIEPSYGMNTGLELTLELDEDNVFHTTKGVSFTLTGTSESLPTTCLSWNGEVKRFVSPTFTSTSSTSTAIATSSGATGTRSSAASSGGTDKKSIGAKGKQNLINDQSVFWWSAGMMMTVFLTAMWL